MVVINKSGIINFRGDIGYLDLYVTGYKESNSIRSLCQNYEIKKIV